MYVCGSRLGMYNLRRVEKEWLESDVVFMEKYLLKSKSI
jgi:hypothetical protein